MQLLVLLALLTLPFAVTPYDFVREHSGSTFFDDWDFYGSWDNLTLGDVNWLSATDAFNSGLVYVNSAGRAVLRVDNFSNVPWNFKRNAIRITTKDFFNFGTLWVFDVAHIPWGCSVWPSIWSAGDNWPAGGEIDIIEGTNLMQTNQIALHTLPGCTHDPNAPQFGTSGELDCSTPAGCVVKQLNAPTFGDAFALAGGGVWAVQYDIQGVFIWFWNRPDVPVEIYNPAGQGIDISSWGTPAASYPSTTCDMTSFFTPQKIIIDTTLCGNWAGLLDVYAATCGGAATATGQPPSGSCYLDNVVGPGSPKYDDAWWEIASMRVYTTGTNGPGPTAAANARISAASRLVQQSVALGVCAVVLWSVTLIS